MSGCIHAFKEKVPGSKCVWGCGISYESLAKAKEVDPRALQYDAPQRKKRRRPFQSETNWRDSMRSNPLTAFEFKSTPKDVCPFCEKRLKEFKARSKSGFVIRFDLCKKCGEGINDKMQ